MGFLFWSSVISAACLFLCTCLTGHWTTLRAYSMTDLRRIAALATLGAFAYYALLYTAYEPGPSDHTAVVVIAQHTWPALTVLWSAALLRERLNGRMVVSLILGVAAVAIGASATPNAEDGLSKLPPAVLAAIIFGLYSTLLKRVAYEPVSSMTVGFSFAAFLSFVAASQLSTRSLMPDRAALTAAFVNGVFVNGLSYVCWHKALKAAPVKFVAPWVALTPLLAAAFAGRSIVFRPEHWIGIALVLVSTLLATTARGVAVREPLTPAPPPRGHGFNLAEESR